MSSAQELSNLRICYGHIGPQGSLQAAQATRAADRRKDRFLATVAHEMRNPLAAINNALHLWRRAQCNAAEMEELQNLMERQIKQIGRLCEDLLDDASNGIESPSIRKDDKQ